MEPSIDTEVFRNCIREKPKQRNKITFPKLYRLAKAVTSFILFLMIGVLMHQKEVKTYLEGERLFVSEMQEKFDVFLPNPLFSKQICCHTNLYIYYGQLLNREYLIIYPSSNQNINIKIYQNNILLLDYQSKNSKYKRIRLTKDINTFDIYVTNKNEFDFYHQLIVDLNYLPW